jgi:predicted AAA+ superfamily ATPase
MKKSLRYNQVQIEEDLKTKMVLLSGPRQVGKTTLAKQIPNSFYMNWDIPEDREKILRREWPVGKKIWILDEIHKFRNWRSLLKGLYDKYHGETEILVTGSARLDAYRRGGDSLQGRYFFHRLHPFSWNELGLKNKKEITDLLEFGGFPEPLFKQNKQFHKRWLRDYRTRLIQEDLVSLEKIQDLGNLELLSLLLPARVGSPLSYASLSRDIQISPKTALNWVNVLERLYSIFLISSYQKKTIRSVKKEKKHYHWDWSLVESPSARLENLVASHLLKWVHKLQDQEGDDIDLYFFRDTDGREVDFVVANRKKPVIAVEVKLADEEIHKPLKYFLNKFPNTECWQVHLNGNKSYQSQEGIRVGHVVELLARLA